MDERPAILSELDVWRSAQILVQAHGENAPLEAAQRADRALEDGFLDVVAVWKRILGACQELLRSQPSSPNEIN
jgi:hypothetical protein